MQDLSDHKSPPDRTNWPKIRLFVDVHLQDSLDVTLDRDQSHYLTSVMRLSVGDCVRVFNGTSGEWAARITSAGKKAATISIGSQLRPQTNSPDLWLVFAPIKKSGTDFILQKATELGASRIIPVKTRFSESQRINKDRFRSITIEAAEQCERLDIPALDDLTILSALLDSWPPERALIMADEQTPSQPQRSLQDVINQTAHSPRAALIGPEGGFAHEDRHLIHPHPASHTVSLGPRILRAETAAIVLLAHLTEM